jgi:hypothetical protein
MRMVEASESARMHEARNNGPTNLHRQHDQTATANKNGIKPGSTGFELSFPLTFFVACSL